MTCFMTYETKKRPGLAWHAQVQSALISASVTDKGGKMVGAPRQLASPPHVPSLVDISELGRALGLDRRVAAQRLGVGEAEAVEQIRSRILGRIVQHRSDGDAHPLALADKRAVREGEVFERAPAGRY